MKYIEMLKLKNKDVIKEKATGWEYIVINFVSMASLDNNFKPKTEPKKAVHCIYIGSEKIPYWAKERYFEAKEIKII